jgi:hypothetical protein
MNQFRVSTRKKVFLKISVSLHTTFAIESRLTEGQWLEEQVNVLKVRMFRVGTRGRLFRGQGQHLMPLKAFIKNKT